LVVHGALALQAAPFVNAKDSIPRLALNVGLFTFELVSSATSPVGLTVPEAGFTVNANPTD